MDDGSLDSLSLVQRLSLLSIAAAVADGTDPVDSREVRERSTELLDEVDAAVVSQPTERDVMSALSGLAAEPYVEEHQDDQSPTGKGRPGYTLTTDVDTIFDGLAADDRLSDAIDHVRE